MWIDNREYSDPELKSYIMGLQKRIADAENLNGELKKEKAELYEALENYCFASAMANTKEKKNNFDICLNSEIQGNEELYRKNADHVIWETKLLKALEQVAKDIAAFKAVLVENNCRIPCEKCLFWNDGNECAYKYMGEIKKLIGGDDNG